MATLEEATRLPVFMQEEDGMLYAYIGERGTENVALLACVRTEAMNMVTPPSAALDAFRALVRLLGQGAMQQVRAEVTTALLTNEPPKLSSLSVEAMDSTLGKLQ